ncbi:O-antigen ligase family protein [Phenylobacterium sp. LjRoot225]|uniref:O-antigen ligase family protein n=1 Tax=Phenylobacterium sp. LjRoot225 TaxID=3342285 RepID=UPI003ECF4494
MSSFRATPDFQRGAPRAFGLPIGARVTHQGAIDFGLVLIALIYFLYVPVGRFLIHNEYVYGPNGLSEALQKIWSGGRYLAALGLAPLLLARSGLSPLARCWPAFPFAIFAAASCAWSAFPKESMRESLNLFFILVTISTLVTWYGLAGFGRRAQIVTGLFMMASVLTALLIPHLGVHHDYDLASPLHAGKWRGIFRHKNELGELAVTSIIFSLRSIRNETMRWKVFFTVARLSTLLCLIMSFSSNAWLGAIIGVTFFMLMKNRATANPIVIAVFILLGAALVQGLSLNAGQIAQALGRDATFTGRTDIWALGRAMMEDHWLLGFGFATDGLVFGQLATGSLFPSAVDLHSGYLDVLFNLGVVGAVLMFIAVVTPVVRGYVYALGHTGEERDQAVIFMSLFVAACAIAVGEIAPFCVAGDGAVSLWTAVPALYQLGATALDRRLRAANR